MVEVVPRLRFLLSSSLFAVSAGAFAWNATGHMLVADIAQRNLRAEVDLECSRLLKVGATTQAYDFVTAGPWADAVRNDRKETGPWHYINFHFRTDGKPVTNEPEPSNVIFAIDQQATILADRTKPDMERADALRYLIHFVGDVHQPLHATAKDSDAFPKGDRGGNDFKIGVAPMFRQQQRPPTNLHALWDGGGGLFPDLGQNPLARQIIDLQAMTLLATVPAPATFGTPKTWADESFGLAKSFVYSTPEGDVPSGAYLAQTQSISAHQAAFAGYRLADLLNHLLG